MDGLAQEKNAPFILLASNFPQQLAHAVLRRVASRHYIRLPPADSRKRILDIFLREEKLCQDVDLATLSSKMRGYTGSDIQTLYVQAALTCEADLEGLDESGMRILTKSHFMKAFESTGRTVSTEALNAIRIFANEFDPNGMAKVLVDEREMNISSPASYLPILEDPNMRDAEHRARDAECRARYDDLLGKTPVQRRGKWQVLPKAERSVKEGAINGPLPSYSSQI